MLIPSPCVVSKNVATLNCLLITDFFILLPLTFPDPFGALLMLLRNQSLNAPQTNNKIKRKTWSIMHSGNDPLCPIHILSRLNN